MRNKRENNRDTKRNHKRESKREFNKEVVETVSLEDVVFGPYPTIEALQARRGNKLFIQEDLKSHRIEELKELSKEFSVPIVWAPKSKLDDMTNKENHQGIVLKITPYEYLSLEELLSKTKEKENRFFLILDSIKIGRASCRERV